MQVSSVNLPINLPVWQYAYSQPNVVGVLKQKPEDFVVDECMVAEPCGEGEHVWLHITKRQQNTEQVAKALARFANVAYRDMGYSGMKDFQAITHQWFSVWLPKLSEPNWAEFSLEGVTVNQVKRHTRKIKRGTHQSNHFTITIRELEGDQSGLLSRLQEIAQYGAPNYFGDQRFGRNGRNMELAYRLLVDKQTIKQRHLRSLALSTARSWLFNHVLSARIEEQSWQTLYPLEPLNLDGSGSCFFAHEDSENLSQRLSELDIHPTGPMWGKVNNEVKYTELDNFERSVISPYLSLADGLENAGLTYQRRPLRLCAKEVQWHFSADGLVLRFALSRGQFATSVLREIVSEKTIKNSE